MEGVSVIAGVTVTKISLPELYEILSYAVLSGVEGVILNLFKLGLGQIDHGFLVEIVDNVAAKLVDKFCGDSIAVFAFLDVEPA